jgi:uncharacterized protein YyaL (SSP411 family)
MANQLTSASSAYLLSAAHQPVSWLPWSPAAFAAARTADRPILLDIGAVWCHWCHVMDGESYEDPSLAEFLNQHFICVKVDRDERPDVDTRYQRAVQAITGQGGWPLTAFLTPDGEVFYGGTYFPPDGKYGRPGFRSVLQQVVQVYRTQPDRVQAQARTLREALEAHLDESGPGQPSPALLDQAGKSIARLFDSTHGGFGTQPKFPHPAVLRFLMVRWRDGGEAWARDIVERTLEGMAHGGIHDQLGGGFHRYSVDARWIVPHFEKMSYDNAELLRSYLDGYALLGREEFAEVARGIVRWVLEVLAHPEGGYGASQDADVGLDDDGDYFTWTLEEAEAVLTPDELAIAAAYYDIGTAGEMHHNPAKNVLFVAEPLESIARRLKIELQSAIEQLNRAREKLFSARNRRTAPFIDRTRYAAWNAMLAGALLQAGAQLDDPWARDHALLSLERLRAEQADPDRIAHTPGGVTGLLDDQVNVAAAALDAYEHTGKRAWLDWAVAIMNRVWREYRDSEAGGLFDQALDQAGEGLLPTRAKPVQDAPTPSGNGVAALVAARLSELTGDPEWIARRDAIVNASAGRAGELGLHGATMLLAIDWAIHPAAHVVIADHGTGAADALHRQSLSAFLPRRVVQRVGSVESEGASVPHAIREMLHATNVDAAFLCVGARCLPPVQTEADWGERLEGLRD